MLAPVPQNQAARLAAIRRYDLGTQVHVGHLDGIVGLACQLTDCPMALVSIVHDDRQEFEATCGLDLRKSGLQDSICSHAILLEDVLEIPDLRLDPRTADNAFVVAQNDPLLFYVGAQIVTAEGAVLGTVCALDRKPRTMTTDQRRGLRALAQQVMRVLELGEAVRDKMVETSVAHLRLYRALDDLDGYAKVGRRVDVSGPKALDSMRARIERHRMLERRLELPEGAPEMIDLSAYLSPLVRSAAALAPNGVDVSLRFDAMPLRLRAARTLGRLAVEVLQFACAREVPGGRPAHFDLSGALEADGCYTLSARSDWADMADGRAEKIKAAIMSYAQNLGATLTVERIEGGEGSRLSVMIAPSIPN